MPAQLMIIGLLVCFVSKPTHTKIRSCDGVTNVPLAIFYYNYVYESRAKWEKDATKLKAVIIYIIFSIPCLLVAWILKIYTTSKVG